MSLPLSLYGRSRKRTTPVDIFIIVGQSNSVGQGSSASSPIAANGLYIAGGGAISSPLADPVGTANTGSAWPSFSNEWFNQTGRRSAFIEAASVGTALLPNASGQWSPAGTLRALAVTAANTAIAAIPAAGYTLGSVYFLWAQGETDAANYNGSTITGPIYNTALQALADYFKAQIPSMVCMGVSQTGISQTGAGTMRIVDSTDSSWMLIRQAQADAVAADANLKMLFIGAYAFGPQGKQASGLHYYQTGYNTMGVCIAKQLASPVSPGAISPFLASVSYPDTNFTATSTRTDAHTTAAGTTLIIVTLAVGISTNNTQRTATVTFGGVAMLFCGDVEAFTFGVASDGRSQSMMYYIDAATYGGSLAGITQNIVSTVSSISQVLALCAINAKDVAVVDQVAGIFPSPVGAAAATVSISTFAPTLIVTLGVASSLSAAALTCALTNSTKIMDSGASNATNSNQMVVGYSAEATTVNAKGITATWSANVLSASVLSVAFRAKVAGE